MNRKQRKQGRQRIARINKAKKASKKPRVMTRQDIERIAVMIEGFVASDREFVEDYSTKAKRTKNGLFVFSALCIVFGSMLFLGIDLGINKVWNALMFFAFLVLAIIQGDEYGLYRSRLPFWKQELQENTKLLNGIKLHLQQFKVIQAT